MDAIYKSNREFDDDRGVMKCDSISEYSDVVSLLSSKGLRGYTFPTLKIIDPDIKPVWTLKLTPDPAKELDHSEFTEGVCRNISKKETNSSKNFWNLAKAKVSNRKKSIIASAGGDRVKNSSVKVEDLTEDKNSNDSGDNDLNISPWSKLEQFQIAYDCSMKRAVLSCLSISPYIYNFWQDTPSGPQPKEQDIFVFTGHQDHGLSPVVIAVRDYSHMRAKIAVIWTPFGRDYFAIGGSQSSAITARITLALFLQHLSDSDLNSSASLSSPSTINHAAIFEEVFRKAKVFNETNHSIVNILYESEVSEVPIYHTIDVITSIENYSKVKFLFDYGLFGDPIVSIRGDRSSSQLLATLGAISIDFLSQSGHYDDFLLSEEEYRREMTNGSNVKKHSSNDSYIIEKIREIIETEIRYVNRQERLVESTDFVNSEYASRCMPSPEPVVNMSQKLLASLGFPPNSLDINNIDEVELPTLEVLCNSFIEMFESDEPSILEVYRNFILNYEISKSFFSEVSSKNNVFFSARREAYFLEHGEKTSVESLRIEPTQRVGRYRVMLESIAIALDPSHECLDMVWRAAYLARAFSERLNHEDDISLNAKANILLSHRLRLTLPVFDLQSWYICEMVVNLVCSTSNCLSSCSRPDYTLLLYSSSLLIIHNSYMLWRLQPKDSHNPLCYSLNLSEIEVLNCSVSDLIIYRNERMFFRFRAKSEKEKADFLRILGRQMFFHKSQTRSRVPYDAYSQVLDGRDLYYRVIGTDALEFEIASNEMQKAFGIFLCASEDDYVRNVDRCKLKYYENVALVDIRPNKMIRSSFVSHKELKVMSQNLNTSGLWALKVLNEKFDPKFKDLYTEKSLPKLSDQLKSAVTNYIHLSCALSFDTDHLWRNRRLLILMCGLVCSCGIIVRKSSKAMSILTKKSRASRMSIMSFTYNIKKRIGNLHIKINPARRGSAQLPLDISGLSYLATETGLNRDNTFSTHSSTIIKNGMLPKKNSNTSSTSRTSRSNTPITKDELFDSYEKIVHCVKSLIDNIECKDNMDVEGIYRISGSKTDADSHYNDLILYGQSEDAIDQCNRVLDVHTSVSTLKSLLKDFFLKYPIISSKDELEFLGSESQLSSEEKIRKARILLGADRVDQDIKAKILDLLFCHLHKVSKNSHRNLMQSSKLANVLSPTLFNNLFSDYSNLILFVEAINFFINYSTLIYKKSQCHLNDPSDSLLKLSETVSDCDSNQNYTLNLDTLTKNLTTSAKLNHQTCTQDLEMNSDFFGNDNRSQDSTSSTLHTHHSNDSNGINLTENLPESSVIVSSVALNSLSINPPSNELTAPVQISAPNVDLCCNCSGNISRSETAGEQVCVRCQSVAENLNDKASTLVNNVPTGIDNSDNNAPEDTQSPHSYKHYTPNEILESFDSLVSDLGAIQLTYNENHKSYTKLPPNNQNSFLDSPYIDKTVDESDKVCDKLSEHSPLFPSTSECLSSQITPQTTCYQADFPEQGTGSETQPGNSPQYFTLDSSGALSSILCDYDFNTLSEINLIKEDSHNEPQTNVVANKANIELTPENSSQDIASSAQHPAIKTSVRPTHCSLVTHTMSDDIPPKGSVYAIKNSETNPEKNINNFIMPSYNQLYEK